ncbi:MAG: TlyA family RNA methyltransferase [Deltaproteobacteria bacterium]|nr:TlyA family RNA methyltransferase [Deltaproteobacteria bacterium]
MAKERVDKLLVDRGLAPTREHAQRLVMAGLVFSGDASVAKPGARMAVDAPLDVRGEPHPFVGRGGAKLDAALAALALDVEGLVALDVGASTGGFTDCLLQRGARRVYAVDVGYGQLAWKLRTDPRVVSRERTNVRDLARDAFDEPIDLVTIDASFISLRLVLPAVLRLLDADRRIVALVKPQFEVGKGEVGKGGVVRDPARHADVLATLQRSVRELGLRVDAVLTSPLLGPAGNREFFLVLATPPPFAPRPTSG